MPLGPMSLMVVLLFLALNSNRSSPFIFCVCACIFVLLKPATLVEAISTFPKGSLSITADISILPKRLRNKRERRAITAIIRKFNVADVEQVLALAQRYASWDATPTEADIEGFHSTNPEVCFVAEADEKIVGFVYGKESNPPAEVLDKWNSRKVASN